MSDLERLKELLQRRYKELNNDTGCYVNNHWLSVAAIMELIKQVEEER